MRSRASKMDAEERLDLEVKARCASFCRAFQDCPHCGLKKALTRSTRSTDWFVTEEDGSSVREWLVLTKVICKCHCTSSSFVPLASVLL